MCHAPSKQARTKLADDQLTSHLFPFAKTMQLGDPPMKRLIILLVLAIMAPTADNGRTRDVWFERQAG